MIQSSSAAGLAYPIMRAAMTATKAKAATMGTAKIKGDPKKAASRFVKKAVGSNVTADTVNEDDSSKEADVGTRKAAGEPYR